MAATKTNTSLLSAQATTTTTTAHADVSAHYADTVAGSITQVGTATSPASIQVLESFDGGTTYLSTPTRLFTAGLVAGTYAFEIPVDPAATNVDVTYAQQSGGSSSSCTAVLASVTGI